MACMQGNSVSNCLARCAGMGMSCLPFQMLCASLTDIT